MVQVFDNELIDSLTTTEVSAEKKVGFVTQLLCCASTIAFKIHHRHLYR